MTRTGRRRSALGVVLSALLLAFTAGVGTQPSDLGTIDFPTSGAGAAQESFIRGVLLMHSFEYAEARKAFRDAQKIDPAFAMAYWGEAMTYHHPLSHELDVEAAGAAMARLAPTAEARLAKAATPGEKAWLAALDVLLAPGEDIERAAGYADALRRMHEMAPGDDEVSLFYALALMGTDREGRDARVTMRAAALAEGVFSKNPRHPGAAHYLVRAFDDPVHAPLGLRAANAYARLAPPGAYPLHVPSHIYVALGMWDEASAANERAVQVRNAAAAQAGGAGDESVFHSLLWLEYSYLQQGRYVDARTVLDRLDSAGAGGETASVAREHRARGRAAWVVETRRWTDARSETDGQGLPTAAAAAEAFAAGLAAIKSGDRAAGQGALQRIATLAGDAPLEEVPGRGGQPLAVVSSGAADVDKRVASVMAQQLEAALLFIEGRREEGLVLARQAAVVEDALLLDVGPPLPVKPTHELVAEMLLDLKRPREAMGEFGASLDRAPRRALSLVGLARAAVAARDRERAQAAYRELGQVWHNADRTLPELKELAIAVSPASR